MPMDPSDKTIPYQSPPALQADLENSPLAPAIDGGTIVLVFMWINLLCTLTIPWTGGLMMCIGPVGMLASAGGAAIYCRNSASKSLGIASRWPFWVSASSCTCVTAALTLGGLMLLGGPPGAYQDQIEVFILGLLPPLILCSIVGSYVAAIHRAGEYGKVCDDRQLVRLAKLSKWILVVVTGFAVSAMVFGRAWQLPRLGAAIIGIATLVTISLAMIGVFRRSRRLLRRVATDQVREAAMEAGQGRR